MIFISDVIQKVEDMQKQKTVPSSAVIQFLSNIDLSHVLPSKAPTTARKFMVCWRWLSWPFDYASSTLYSGLMHPWSGWHPWFGVKSMSVAWHLLEFGTLRMFVCFLSNMPRTNRSKLRRPYLMLWAVSWEELQTRHRADSVLFSGCALVVVKQFVVHYYIE